MRSFFESSPILSRPLMLVVAGVVASASLPTWTSGATVASFTLDDRGWMTSGGAVVAVGDPTPGATASHSTSTTVRGITAVREILATKRQGPGGRFYSVVETPAGLAISSDVGVQGDTELTFEFSKPMDITEVFGTDQVEIEIEWIADHPGALGWVTLRDALGGSDRVPFASGASFAGGFAQETYAAMINASAVPNVDLGALNSVGLVLDNPVRLDGLLLDVRASTVVPEPGRPLLLIAAFGLTVLRRRRRR